MDISPGADGIKQHPIHIKKNKSEVLSFFSCLGRRFFVGSITGIDAG
jgi:hypothetical protein